MREITVEVIGGEIDALEKKAYIDRALEKFGSMVTGIRVMLDSDYTILNYQLKTNPFERIRRIREERS